MTTSGSSSRDDRAAWVAAFVRDRAGNDMIEYALIALLFGIVGVIVFNQIGLDIVSALTNWDTNVQNIWVVPDPGGGGS